jgi:Eukaryotic aspartyl protease
LLWYLVMPDVRIGSQSLCTSGDCYGIVDSGTSYLIMPYDAYVTFHSQVCASPPVAILPRHLCLCVGQLISASSGQCQDVDYVGFMCPGGAQLPTFHFRIPIYNANSTKGMTVQH